MDFDVIYNQDCLEGMKDIPDGSIDMILCDLPYGVLNRQNKHAKWDNVIPFEPLWEQYKRVIKKNGAIVLFGQGMFTAELMVSNKTMWKYNLIWHKTDRPTGFLNARRMPLREHEDIMVFYKELPVYNPQMVKCEPHQRNHSRGKMEKEQTNRCYGEMRKFDEVITDEKYPRSIVKFPREEKTEHPTQKPVALCEWLIKTYSNVGEVVLDNCIGSGTTAVACINTDRHYVGFETVPAYYNLALSRCRDAVMKKKQSLEEWL